MVSSEGDDLLHLRHILILRSVFYPVRLFSRDVDGTNFGTDI